MPTPSPGDLTARTVNEQFLDLICKDLELLRAEFDAIIATEWPSPPMPSAPGPIGARPVNREAHRSVDDAPGAGSTMQRPGVGEWARQRSPPPRRKPGTYDRRAGDRPRVHYTAVNYTAPGDGSAPPAGFTPTV